MITFRAKRIVPGALLACLLASVGAAQTTSLGDYVGDVEFYVALPPLGAPNNPGTLAAPLSSVTGALAAATTGGIINNQDMTINLIGAGPFNQASGEVFPIAIPAHGVSIEAHYAVGGTLPLVSSAGVSVPEIFLVNTVGNQALSPSVIRGLSIANSYLDPNGADIRIAVPAQTNNLARVAPEIRDCLITGIPHFGIQVVGADLIDMEPAIERNHITSQDAYLGTAGVDVIGVAQGIMSPLIRSNQIDLYKTNLRISGGGLANQTRVQSNFIQVGEVNVDLIGCAPWLVNNTIAFASSNTLLSVVGLRWDNTVPALGLSNNLMWNPDQNGVTANDVVGNLNVFAGATTIDRWAYYNADEDNTLKNATGTFQGVVTLLTFGGAVTPKFLGGDLGNGSMPVDLHLSPSSPLVGAGRWNGTVSLASGVMSSAITAGANSVNVRRDTVYDIDFEGRLQGARAIEIGADAYTDVNPAENPSTTRGAILRRRVAATYGADLDVLGNLRPDANGLWNTQVEVKGKTGDIVILYGGIGFLDQVTIPAGPTVENRFLYQNFIVDANVIPGLLSSANIGFELGPNSIQLAAGVIPNSGILVLNMTFGTPSSTLLEGEVYLQALVSDNALRTFQTTTRMTVETNE